MLFQTEFPLQRGNACQNAVLKNHAQPRHSPGGKEHHQAHVPASLGELAARVGITNVNLSNLKTGKVKAIRFSTLNAICGVLHCQPGDLLEFVPDEEEEHP